MRAVDGQAARAVGNHRVAQNDEPEPYARPSESELLAGDVQRAMDKAARRVERDVRVGVEEQAQWWGWPL